MGDRRSLTSPYNGMLGGRPPCMSEETLAATRNLYLYSGMSVTEIARLLKINRSTVYRHLHGFGSGGSVLRVGIEDLLVSSRHAYKRLNLFIPSVSAYDISVARLLGEALEMRIQLFPLRFDTIRESVRNGTLDMALGQMAATKARSKDVLFSDPYVPYEKLGVHLFYSERRFSQKAPPIAFFYSKRVGYQAGTLHEEYLKNHSEFIKVRRFIDFRSMERALIEGRVDAILCHRYEVGSRELGRSEPIDHGCKTCVVLRKGDLEGQDRINKLLDTFSHRGILGALKAFHLDRNLTLAKFKTEIRQIPALVAPTGARF